MDSNKAIPSPRRLSGRFPRRAAIATLSVFSLGTVSCSHDEVSRPFPSSGLVMSIRFAPLAPQQPAVGRPDSLRIDLRGAGGELLEHPTLIALDPSDRRFQVSLAAPLGEDRQITVMALGPRQVLGGSTDPESSRGILFHDRVTGVDVIPGRIPTIAFDLGLFVPEFQPVQFSPGSARHTIRWNPVPGADRYHLRRVPRSGGTSDTVLVDTFFIGNIVPMTYQVSAVDFSGVPSAPSDYREATLAIPGVPGSFAATVVSPALVTLTWSSGGGLVDEFDIQRRTPPLPFETVVSPPGGTLTYEDRGVVDGLAYEYRIRARNSGGASEYTAPVAANVPLAPPSNLEASPISTTAVRLSWLDHSRSESAYEIERRVAPAGAFSLISRVGAGVQLYDDATVNENTTYGYRVRAVNDNGVSEWTSEATVTTPLGPPQTPVNLTAVPISPTEIRLGWSSGGGIVEFYEMERFPGPVPLGPVDAGTTLFVDRMLVDGSAYSYRVRAGNSAGVSDFTPLVEAMTPLAPPSDLSATPLSATSIQLVWNDHSARESGFQIERRLASGGAFSLIATVAAPSHIDAGLAENTAYVYRVRAYNAATVSDWTTEVTATTLLDPPLAPSNLTLNVVSSSRIDLGWTDNSNDETSFEIQRATGTGPFSVVATVGANVMGFSNTQLVENTSYSFRVRALNAAGPSGFSNTATGATPLAIPGVPQNLSGVALSPSQIRITWTFGSGTPAFHDIERRTPPSLFAPLATVMGTTNVYFDSNLGRATTYEYRVRARNSAGSSPFTPAVAVMTPEVPPAAPSDCQADQVAGGMGVFWIDNSDNEDQFDIERRVGTAGAGFVRIGTAPPNVQQFTDSTVVCFTFYTYRVRACNEAGCSGTTNEAGASLLCAGANGKE